MRRKTLIAIAAAAAIALTGCGGGGSDSSSTTASTQATQPATTQTTTQQQNQNQGNSNSNGSQPTTTSQPTTSSNGGSGGSSAAAPGVPTSKGGDNSIQTFGLEASGSDRSQAASTAQAYFDARAAGNWSTACSYMAAPIKQQLGALISQAKNPKAKGCSAALQAMSAGVPKSALRSAAAIRVLSFRAKGAQGFLIYRDGKGTPTALPMVQTGGAWKVGAIAGSALLL